MFPVNFGFIEAVAGAILAVMLGYRYIQRRKMHYVLFMLSMIFWSLFEFGVSPLLGFYPAALWGAGMFFLLQGFELFPKVKVQRSWPKYFLLYTLVVYGVIIGVSLSASMQQWVVISAWIFLMIPGASIAISGSISSFFLGRRINTLIAVAILLSMVGEWVIGPILWGSGVNWVDTTAEILIGVGLFFAMEPPLRG